MEGRWEGYEEAVLAAPRSEKIRGMMQRGGEARGSLIWPGSES
jgi:hypothetical protein